MMRRRLMAFAQMALTTSLGFAMAAQAAAGATIVGRHGDWSVYANGEAADRLCFIAAPPASSEPTDSPRDRPLLYISAWPKDGVKSEVSARLGFPIKKGADPTLAVTGTVSATIKLFVHNDRAFVADATQELKLLEAMKKGSKLTIQATSATGTTITDTYGLAGFTAALTALPAACN